MPDLRTKVLGYLRDEKVRILEAATVKPALRPHLVTALVQGFNGRYLVLFLQDSWSCSCTGGDGCAHIAAVQLVTGWPSAASRTSAAVVATS
ncbi:SWIM zinc finger family protein [Nonomuraea sp. NPDC003560]|uniref:SWIM zinc finger family protein n=1 Tax=Nonomuraea sp. NPDC003560 TaxID=3364341 RepID=UPI0036902DF4